LSCLRAEIKNNKFLVHANYYLIDAAKVGKIFGT
jgi:hypothetical protein